VQVTVVWKVVVAVVVAVVVSHPPGTQIHSQTILPCSTIRRHLSAQEGVVVDFHGAAKEESHEADDDTQHEQQHALMLRVVIYA
jgi:hypothetical protein